MNKGKTTSVMEKYAVIPHKRYDDMIKQSRIFPGKSVKPVESERTESVPERANRSEPLSNSDPAINPASSEDISPPPPGIPAGIKEDDEMEWRQLWETL